MSYDEDKVITTSDIERLEEIEFEILELADEAFGIVRGTSEEGRSKAYWYGEIWAAMNNEKYVASSCTLQDVIDALTEYAEEDDDNDEDDEDGDDE